jgi:hypothetical protein
MTFNDGQICADVKVILFRIEDQLDGVSGDLCDLDCHGQRVSRA